MKEKFERSHQRLDVWKKAMELVTEVYQLIATFPKHEKYGLSSQISRAAVSIPANLAEGAGRDSIKEYLRFLYYSRGSISELETLLIIAQRLKYNEKDASVFALLQETSSLLNGLIKYIQSLNK